MSQKFRQGDSSNALQLCHQDDRAARFVEAVVEGMLST